MSAPDREAELMDTSQDFWDQGGQTERVAILMAGGYELAPALDLSKTSFAKLATWAQRLVVRIVGEALAEKD